MPPIDIRTKFLTGDHALGLAIDLDCERLTAGTRFVCDVSEMAGRSSASRSKLFALSGRHG